jgi:hypothetical protein
MTLSDRATNLQFSNSTSDVLPFVIVVAVFILNSVRTMVAMTMTEKVHANTDQ